MRRGKARAGLGAKDRARQIPGLGGPGFGLGMRSWGRVGDVWGGLELGLGRCLGCLG